MTDTTATTPESAAPQERPDEPVRMVALQVSDDQVQILLDAEAPLVDLADTAERIHAACEELKLPEIPETAALEGFLRQVAKPGEDLVDESFIMGRYPSPSEDGKLVWAREFFREGWAVDGESGAMDFWEPLERRSVSKDEEICRLIPPIPGRAGLTVFDLPIPVRKPKAEKLRPGKNVTSEDLPDGSRRFVATCDGRVQFAVGTVSVDDVYIIKGNVSLETGNVYHTGSVQIQGDIKAGAIIDVGGDIIVKGLVENSTISCGGSLAVDGGIVGDGVGTVTAVGDVQALYVNEAVIRCEGNVVIKNEISHTDVFTHGQVLVQDGRIAGGQVEALRGIHVGQAGAGGATRTRLAAGVDPSLAENIARLRRQLPRLEKVRSRLRKTLMGFRMDLEETSEEHQLAMEMLREKIKQVDAASEQVALDVEEIRKASAALAVSEIQVFEELWSGTVLQLGESSTTVRKSVHKPRRVRLYGHDVMVLPMAEDAEIQELPDTADETESADTAAPPAEPDA